MAANHTPGGGATIIVPNGFYPLTIQSVGADDESTGDLNVTNIMTIQGAGPGVTFLAAAGLNDRVFDVAVGGPVTITGVSISQGTVNGPGGGIYAAAYPLTLSNSQVRRNHAEANGGGIYNNYNLVVTNSFIDDNDTNTAGGGVWAGPEVWLNDSTVSDNLANDGAGIYNYLGSVLHLTNSTVAGNLAKRNGGGVYNDTGGDVGLSSSTIANCTVNGPYTQADPGLGPLQDNGSPTPTLALSRGSPAIDAGVPSGCRDEQGQLLLTDQRGWTRIIGPHCDIGAYEATLDLWLPLLKR